MKKLSLLIILLIFVFKILCSSSDKIDSFYYSPNVNKLYLREKPTTKSKAVRFLLNGEEVIFLKKGNEEVINGDKGTWIKVLTDKFEFGWVFDAYIDKVDFEYEKDYINTIFGRNIPIAVNTIHGPGQHLWTGTTKDSHIIEGVVIPNAKRIEIEYNDKIIYSREYNDITYPHYFSYNLSKKNNTLIDGINKYKLRCFKNNEFAEDFYEVFYNLEVSNPAVSNVIRNNEKKWFKYSITEKADHKEYEINIFSNRAEYDYRPVKDFNKYEIELSENEKLLIFKKNIPDEDNIDNMPYIFRYTDKKRNIQKDFDIGDVLLVGFQGTPINMYYYNNGDFIFITSSGHEGMSDHIFFNYKTAGLTKISDFLKNMLNEDYFPSIKLSIKGESLLIEEFKTQFTRKNGPLKTFNINKNTMKVISVTTPKLDEGSFYLIYYPKDRDSKQEIKIKNNEDEIQFSEIKDIDSFKEINRKFSLRFDRCDFTSSEIFKKLNNNKYLVSLNIDQSEIGDSFKDLNLPSLETLIIYNCNNKSQSIVLKNLNLQSLTKLNIGSNFKGMNNVNIPNIKELFLTSSNLEEIPDLSKYPGLEKLCLYSNKIEKIKNLSKFNRLKLLDLKNNKINKIEGLENLINLKDLFLDDNNISKIEGLEKLKNLENLFLNRNKISKIEGLEKNEKLSKLYLNGNPISKDIIKQISSSFKKNKNLKIYY